MTSLLRPISVGPVTLENNVVLAPMSGVSDMPFRRLVKGFGAGLVISEMIASEAMIRATRRSMKMADNCADEFPMAVQLAGCEARVMAEAARLNVDRGAAIIDINMGCPVKKVVNGEAGSALMKDEVLAGRILEATVSAVDVPVTLKMRTGWNQQNRNAPRLAKIAEEAGIQMITVHGRTRCQLYNGQADWDFIREVAESVRIPVLANGDVVTVDHAAEILRRSGAQGVMVGRGSYGRPWFLGQVIRFLADGTRLPDPAPEVRGRILLEHYDALLSHYGEEAGVRIARKHVGWYSKGLPGSAEFRSAVNRLAEPGEVRDMITAFFTRRDLGMAA